MRRLALRDAALLLATLAFWAIDSRARAGGSAPLGIAVATGVLTALCGYLAHEWGHLLGARLGGSTVHPAPSLASVFLFRYDADRNTRRQFLAMTLGGFVASGLVVWLLLAVLPRDAASGRVALALVGLGVLATIVLEFPPAWRVARGAAIPHGAAYVSAGSGSASG